MQVDIKTKFPIKIRKTTNLDRVSSESLWPIDIDENWHKITIPCDRNNIIDITINNESIKHCLNAGINTENGYEIWLHGNLAEYFSRIAKKSKASLNLNDDVFFDKSKRLVITVDTYVEIVMISEDLEDSLEIMQILQEKLIMPGYKHLVANISTALQSISLKQNNMETVLPMHVAKKIYAINVEVIP